MDEQFQVSVNNDGFKLGKKWFWVGVIVGILNIVGGLIYGIALAMEKEHRKEGLIIIAVTVIWAIIGFFLVGPWLIKSGMIPKFQVIK